MRALIVTAITQLRNLPSRNRPTHIGAGVFTPETFARVTAMLREAPIQLGPAVCVAVTVGAVLHPGTVALLSRSALIRAIHGRLWPRPLPRPHRQLFGTGGSQRPSPMMV